MKKETKNKFGAAFKKFIDNPDFVKGYEEEFKEFALNELLLTHSNKETVRKLAEKAGLSPTTIQNIRSGKKSDVKLSNFLSIVSACGYEVELVKGDERLHLSH